MYDSELEVRSSGVYLLYDNWSLEHYSSSILNGIFNQSRHNNMKEDTVIAKHFRRGGRAISVMRQLQFHVHCRNALRPADYYWKFHRPTGHAGASQLVTRSTRHSPNSYDELTGGWNTVLWRVDPRSTRHSPNSYDELTGGWNTVLWRVDRCLKCRDELTACCCRRRLKCFVQ